MKKAKGKSGSYGTCGDKCAGGSNTLVSKSDMMKGSSSGKKSSKSKKR